MAADERCMLVVMGVSGAGKTTLGEALARALGWPFIDGDALHPKGNVEKMAAGHPLDDEDRRPWLAAVGQWIDAEAAKEGRGVITCSALKRRYRDTLVEGRPFVRFVYIDLAQAVIAERLQHRKGHFMPPSLLASQFADLEPPAPDEPVIRVDGRLPTEAEVAAIRQRLAAGAGACTSLGAGAPP